MLELVFILDESGSMADLTEDTIGGFNSLLEKQRDEAGEVLVSTVLFNTETKVLHDRLKIEDVPRMTKKDYCPGGCTALLDAVGGAIRHIGTIHKYARKSDVPDRTLFVITTDGLENASRRYTRDDIRVMIQRQKSLHDWEFLFLGANLDAVAEAARYGIDNSRSVQYISDKPGTALNYQTLCDAVTAMRYEGAIPEDWNRRIQEDVKKRASKKR